MQRDSDALLWHVRDAATAVAAFVEGVSYAEYRDDVKLRMAVERAFTIVGEALAKLRRADPVMASKVPNLADIVGFRNVLVHAYADIDDRVVWHAATKRVPELLAVVSDLLGGPFGGSGTP